MSLKEMRDNNVSLPKIVAVDFDGTLVTDEFPEIGRIKLLVWDTVITAQENGYKVILWTCRNGEALKKAVDFCAMHGLHFDAINENLDEIKILYGGDTRKVFADLYIDDRCCLVSEAQGLFCPDLIIN